MLILTLLAMASEKTTEKFSLAPDSIKFDVMIWNRPDENGVIGQDRNYVAIRSLSDQDMQLLLYARNVVSDLCKGIFEVQHSEATDSMGAGSGEVMTLLEAGEIQMQPITYTVYAYPDIREVFPSCTINTTLVVEFYPPEGGAPLAHEEVELIVTVVNVFTDK